MTFMRRMAAYCACAAVYAIVAPGPALAAPPPNDDFDQAIVVTSLPFTDTQDMTDATLAPDDPLGRCGGGPGGTIWYSFTPAHSGTYGFEGLGSTPGEPGIDAWQGTRGNLVQLSYPCAPGFTQRAVDLQAGVTYYFEPENFNGSMQFNLHELRPPATIAVTLDAKGSSAFGSVTVTGVATCSYATVANVSVSATQLFAKRSTASGGTSLTTRVRRPASGGRRPWPRARPSRSERGAPR
jgi:hypothetical protein